MVVLPQQPPKPTLSAQEAAEAFLQKQLKKARVATRQLLDGEGAEQAQTKAVHDLRVGARRLRVGLKVFAGLLPKKLAKKLNKQIHELQDAAAQVRDLDVWRIELARLQKGRRYQKAVAFASTVAQNERLALHAKLNKKTSKLASSHLLQKAKKRVNKALTDSAEASHKSLSELAQELLPARLKEFEAAFAKAANDQPHELHQARIAAKKVRYSLELFSAAYDHNSAKRALKTLKQLQDTLGKLHDFTVFADLSRELAAAEGADSETRASLGLLSHYYDKLVAQKTKDFRHSWEAQDQNGPLAALAGLD